MKDVVEALACWEAVVGINPFKAAHSKKHPNRRSQGKEGLRFKGQLRVVDGHLHVQSQYNAHSEFVFVRLS